MPFDIRKIQDRLTENGINENQWADMLIEMAGDRSVQARMYSHRMMGEIFMSPKLNGMQKQAGILDDFGMGQLGLSVQEARRLGIQQAEIVSDTD